ARAFWGGDYEPQTLDGIAAQITAAGFEMMAHKAVSDIAWESYYRPMEDRISKLRRGADDRLLKALEEAAAEIEGWRANKAETGYMLCVVRPK
ncbi:MAG: class I SAM-dependent methyltransferase, partial [Pseudomonadota bacterium]